MIICFNIICSNVIPSRHNSMRTTITFFSHFKMFCWPCIKKYSRDQRLWVDFQLFSYHNFSYACALIPAHPTCVPTPTHTYVCTCTYIYIYIYIHTHTRKAYCTKSSSIESVELSINYYINFSTCLTLYVCLI